MDEKKLDLNNISLSIVIPVLNDLDHMKILLPCLLNQTYLPQEIIIVDSSKNDDLVKIIKKFNQNNIFKYYKIERCFPGKSTNYGVKFSKSNLIGFLDSKTIPKKNWIKDYVELIKKYNFDLIFGVTEFSANSNFQKLILSASYGNIFHETFPGTIVKKNIYLNSGGLNENVRAGYDIEWRNIAKKLNLKYYIPTTAYINYSAFPQNIKLLLKKYINYSFHTAKIDIQKNTKDLYLSLFIIFTSLIIPKWNYLIGGWDLNPLFVPHITKIYLIIIISVFVGFQISNFLINVNRESLFDKTIKLVILFFVTLGVMRWNDVIANWIEDAVLYIPHITKIYLLLLIISSILFRGIIYPLKRKIDFKYLFPFTWIKIGTLGLIIDIVKAPGYLLGSLNSFFLRNK